MSRLEAGPFDIIPQPSAHGADPWYVPGYVPLLPCQQLWSFVTDGLAFALVAVPQ
jgi:hypothetical protein